jgi:hypothetical protein
MPAGPSGPSGATGPAGPSGGLIAAFNARSNLALLSLTIGDTVIPFNAGVVSAGASNITANGPVNTFIINATGVYRVSYRVTTTVAVLGGGVKVTVNGAPVDPVLSIAVAGTQSDEMRLALTSGQTVQIVLSAILNVGLVDPPK